MSINTFTLAILPKGLKQILASFVIVLAIGVGVGLGYLVLSHGVTQKTTVEHYRGQELADPEEIPDRFPMPVDHLLAIIHTHVISFALIFGIMGVLVWFTASPEKLRKFVAIEPIWGTVVTFGSIALVRFVHADFAWLLMLSGIVMYTSFYLAVALVLKELLFKR